MGRRRRRRRKKKAERLMFYLKADFAAGHRIQLAIRERTVIERRNVVALAHDFFSLATNRWAIRPKQEAEEGGR
jgi:hypothetical protein